MLPVRPKPVITSSAMSCMLCWRMILAVLASQPLGWAIIPAAPWMRGSITKAV